MTRRNDMTDPAEIQRAFRLLVGDGETAELRALQALRADDKWARTWFGYFDNANALVMFSNGGGGHPVRPHLEEIDTVPQNDGPALEPGTLGDGPFAPAVADFYLTNPIARASQLMAELSAQAAARRAPPLAAE